MTAEAPDRVDDTQVNVTRVRDVVFYGFAVLLLGVLALELATLFRHFILGRPPFAGLDTPGFYDYARNLAKGQIPYRDFAFEYPPLAAIPLVLPELVLKVIGGGRLVRYDWLLAAENMLFVLATAGCLVVLARRGWSAATPTITVIRYLILAVATPVLFWRFDAFATLLMMLGLVAWAWRRPLVGGLAIGAGVAAKLFPAFIAPILALADVLRRDWSRPAKLVVGITLAVASVGALFYALTGTGELSFLEYHTDRGVQIESLLASIGMIGQALGSPPASVFQAFGSFQIDSPFLASVPWLDTLLIVAFVGTTALSTVLRFRTDIAEHGEVQPGTLSRQLLVTMFAVLLMYRVLSPQYLAWLIPFAALRPRSEFWAVLLICVITFAIYPLAYTGLVNLVPSAVATLVVRNALMLGMYVWLLVPERVPARTPVYASAGG